MEATNEKAVSPLALVAIFGIASILYVAVKTVVDVYRGPLSHIPGPKFNAVSYIPYVRDLLKGTPVDTTVELHRRYGEVVRLSPTEVSFTSASTAYPDIYGFRTGKLRGHPNMDKDEKWYATPANGVPSILAADDEAHSRGRKVLSHAFSERALNAQEVLVQSYVDKLVTRLREVASKDSQALDIVKWYNWTAFDIIADLMFGEPFGCLDDLSTHQYVELLFSSLQAQVYNALPQYIPVLKYVIPWVVDKKILSKRKEFLAWTEEQVQKRTERETTRPDFMSDILANNGHKGAKLSDKEIHSNAGLILIAGSETTATLLSGATYLLLKNPAKYAKLKAEIRSAFPSSADITLDAVNKLPYLLAVLSESLRVFPPVPVGFVRKTGKGGEVVSGHYIPEGTSLSVSQYAANHCEENFRDAGAFVPERWLDDERYADDKKSGLQPFSFGPRSCLGRNLAYAEMRLILAKMVWSFDFELEARSQDWLERCRVKRLWVKPELAVKVTEVVRA